MMAATWNHDERRRKAVHTIDAVTPLSVLGYTDPDGRFALIVGKDLVLRLSPAAAERVVRLLTSAPFA
jgi:hypothetical protein